MYGTQLAKIDADSIALTLQFDPQMILMHGIAPGRMTKLTDSTIACMLPMTNFPQGTLFSLDAEALLGPDSVSFIHIVASDPVADQPEPASDGLYQVMDCGGSLHGVVLAANYQVQSISPNPASGSITITYQLGFNGPVAIDLYDPLGRVARHIEFPSQGQGAHTATLDLSALPSGRYVYRFESLDFKTSGSVLLIR
jgi:hypothetical protein